MTTNTYNVTGSRQEVGTCKTVVDGSDRDNAGDDAVIVVPYLAAMAVVLHTRPHTHPHAGKYSHILVHISGRIETGDVFVY